MRTFALLSAIAVVMSAGMAAIGASEGISFDVATSSAELALVDTLKVEVVVIITGDEENYSISELPIPTISNFALLSTSSSSMKSITEGIPTVTRSTVCFFRPLAPGTYSIPAMTLEYADVETGTVSSLNSAAISVVVAPPPDDSGRLSGTILLGIVVLVVIVVSIIVYVKTQTRRKASEADADSGTAESRLREQLNKVEIAVAHGRLAEGQALLFASVREYVKDRYGFYGSSAKSGMTADKMVEAGIPKQLCDKYMQLAGWDDELRYGGIPKSDGEISVAVAGIRRFMEQSSVS